MAGAQEEFGNRLLDGYMANLGMSNRLHPIHSVPYPISPHYTTSLHLPRMSSVLAIHFKAYQGPVLIHNQNKPNQQYRNTNPFVRSLNLDV